ncbi:MAG: ABC transporter permease [Planctomycetia bacterium]|nr:ABC transporter permease [Planctomycetia bacterium]MBL6914822.1 ABC transporter permease [Planctomycetota bacterium]HCW45310.1 peptide ABC transporter permease [Planctomycetota bacterium]
MLAYTLRRLLQAIPVILLVTLIVFLLNAAIPGDPGRIRLGQRADPAAVEAYNEARGYNDPIPVQYFNYLWRLFTQFDLGESDVKAGKSVNEILEESFFVTLRLALLSIIVALIVGIGAGILSAVKSRTAVDYISMLIAIIGVSMPVFWLGILMIIYVAPVLGLPRTGFDDTNTYTMLRSLAMPASALGLLSSATIARLSRSAMLDVMTQDYIRTARSKGLAESVVVLKHAMRNAAIPIVTVVGNSFGYLLVGAVLTETVFALPGLGREVVEAIKQRDRELITGGILLMSFVFIGVNLLVDLSYAVFDPRIRDDRS